MIIVLPLVFIPMIFAEPFVYIHPVNPHLYPKDMYPIQRSIRGYQKVRDLPSSGIVYLNRIKPISEEMKAPALARANNTFVIDESAVPLTEFTSTSTQTVQAHRETSTQKQASQDTDISFNSKFYKTPMPAVDSDADVITASATTTTTSATTTTTTTTITTKPTVPVFTTTTTTRVSEDLFKYRHMGAATPKKSGLKIAVSKSKLKPKELEPVDDSQLTVEQVIARLKAEDKLRREMENIPMHPKVETITLPTEMIEKDPKVSTIDIPQKQHHSGKTNQYFPKATPRLVPLSRTAHVHVGETVRTKPSKGRLIGLKKKKAYTVTGGDDIRKGADFDPWERMGQKV
ncbi:hypothetical protein V3C99_003373 [Haemonchus contortus]